MASEKKKTTLVIFEREIGLNEYTTNLLHKIVLAIVSTLRTPELKGTENVRIEISE